MQQPHELHDLLSFDEFLIAGPKIGAANDFHGLLVLDHHALNHEETGGFFDLVCLSQLLFLYGGCQP